MVMDPVEEKIDEAFAAFEREQDAQLLYVGLNEVEEVQRPALPEDRDTCKRGLSLLLTFMAKLEPLIDPNWDRNKVPPFGVPVPIPDVPVYGTGEIDPELIADPEMRARYVQDIKTNHENRIRYNIQFFLRGVEERAVDDFKGFAERCFTGSANNRRELDELLDSATVSDRLKRTLRKAVRWSF